jgi:hypothetical protein
MLNMTETAEKLKLELSHLSIRERAEIASFLIHSLDEDACHDVHRGKRLVSIKPCIQHVAQ